MEIRFSSSNMDFEEVVFEIRTGNQILERRRVRAPEDMLKMMYLDYMRQMAGCPEHMHLSMRGEAVIWDEFEQKQKILPKSVDYWNWNFEGEPEF